MGKALSAREDILKRVRAQPRVPVPTSASSYRSSGSLSPPAACSLFCERVRDYRATVVRTSHSGVPDAIRDAVAGKRIVVPPGFPLQLRPPDAAVDEQLQVTELDSIDAALTTASLAIAETGTIVLTGGPEEGRRAMTLVPDTHICLVDSDSIVQTVPEALEALSTGTFGRRPITFISGPSATSDIEMTRVEGVHGPRNLIVIVRG